MKVRKAIIPVAGFGTRMLPVTKSIPKEMLPLVDKPLIHFIVEECVAAGIKDIILVDHSLKTAVGNYFDVNYELEDKLKKKNKLALLNDAELAIPKKITLASVRQGEAKGLGHAILCARDFVGDEAFVVLLPDILIENKNDDFKGNDLKKMISAYLKTGTSQILVDRVQDNDVDKYGIVKIKENTTVIESLVEKPAIGFAPSNLAVVGRYVLSPSIWKYLEVTAPGAGNEIQLTDAIDALLAEEGCCAYELEGTTWDCGTKLGYVKAFEHYAKKRGFL